MKINYIESEYGNYLEIKPYEPEIFDVVSLIQEDVKPTPFNMSIKIPTNKFEVAETKAKIRFAIDNRDRILNLIGNTSSTFEDIYNNPDLLKEHEDAAIDDNTSKGLIKKEPKTRKSQLDAVAKYQKSRAEIRLRVSPEIKEMADAQARYKGLSLTAYISQLIEADTRERIAEDLEQWKDMRQLEEDNGLDEPITLTALDVDIRDFESMDDARAEADKRAKEFYGI